MDFQQLIAKRYSVRSYKPDPVEKDKLEEILNAARLAPTAANLQPFQLIVVETKGREEELKRIYRADWFWKAPVVICICAVPSQAWSRMDNKNYGDLDATIAMDHLILAAMNLDLEHVGSLPSIPRPLVKRLGYRRVWNRSPSLPSDIRPIMQARRNASLSRILFGTDAGERCGGLHPGCKRQGGQKCRRETVEPSPSKDLKNIRPDYPSSFNDVIGPVMRGPSSSHCAAALCIGRMARDLMDGRLEEVTIAFDSNSSLATTHDSQGSDSHNFSSNRASHDNSVSHNKPGSISMAQDPGRVFPGKKMAGLLGDVGRTVQTLEIVRVDDERNLILVRGAVPGAKNGNVIVSPAVKMKG